MCCSAPSTNAYANSSSRHRRWPCGIIDYYKNSDEADLNDYSAKALSRVWKAERFSWWMTKLLNKFPDTSVFDRRMLQAEFDYLKSSGAAQKSLAENYVGVPY